jgi:hypothetical protein
LIGTEEYQNPNALVGLAPFLKRIGASAEELKRHDARCLMRMFVLWFFHLQLLYRFPFQAGFTALPFQFGFGTNPFLSAYIQTLCCFHHICIGSLVHDEIMPEQQRHS